MMNVPRLSRLVCTGIILFALPAPPRPQESRRVDSNWGKLSGISSIPQDLRSRMIVRTSAYLRAEQDKDWKTIYDLRPPELRTNESKEAFVIRKNSAPELWLNLVDIEPVELVKLVETPAPHEGGIWKLAGCGIYTEKGKQVSYETTIEIRLQRGEWYVGNAGPIVMVDGPAQKRCKFHRESSILGLK